MSFGVGLGDVVTIAQMSKLAWDTYSAIKTAPKEFRALEAEVQSLAISLKSLDDADTTLSILNYTRGNPQREQNLADLLTNSNNALAPMKALVEKYRVRETEEKREIRDWLAGTKFTFKTMSVQEFRNKLALHTTSLNIFLTTLTHSSLGRLERLITASSLQGQLMAGVAGIQTNAAIGNSASSDNNDDGLNGVWTSIGRDLSLSNPDKTAMASDISRFREDISNYVLFLTSGGKAYTREELSRRHAYRAPQKTSYSLGSGYTVSAQNRTSEVVTYSSTPYTLEGEISLEEDDELKVLLNAMISFDGEDAHSDVLGEEDDQTWKNPESVSRSQGAEVAQISLPENEPNGNVEGGPIPRQHSAGSSDQAQRNSRVRCNVCQRRLLVGEMYLHCKICQPEEDTSDEDCGYDVCDPCWEKGKSCPGKHRDEKYFNHRERRIAERDENIDYF